MIYSASVHNLGVQQSYSVVVRFARQQEFCSIRLHEAQLAGLREIQAMCTLKGLILESMFRTLSLIQGAFPLKFIQMECFTSSHSATCC